MNQSLDPAIKIIERIKSKGYKAYLVGGAVREYLLGESPKDFDIATDMPPGELKKLFPNASPVFPERYRIFELETEEGFRFEIAHFRKDFDYKGRHSEIVFTDNIEEDLARRDFTVNAIAMDPTCGKIIDLFGGQEDLRRRLVRALGNPEVRFEEDRVRIFRAIRLAAKIGGKFEIETWKALVKLSERITELSNDTLRLELGRILELPRAPRGVYLLYRAGIINKIFNPHEQFKIKELCLALRFAVRKSYPLPLRWALMFYFLGLSPEKINELGFPRADFNLLHYILTCIEPLKLILSDRASPEEQLRVIDNPALSYLVLTLKAITFAKERRVVAYEGLISALYPGIGAEKLISGDEIKRRFGISGKAIGEAIDYIRLCQLKGEINDYDGAMKKLEEFIRQKGYEKGSH